MSGPATFSGATTPAGATAAHTPDASRLGHGENSTVDMSGDSSPNGHHVDIDRAKAEFSMLQTSLSRQSEATRQNSSSSPQDLEAGKTTSDHTDDDDSFDLVQYLRSTQSEKSQAGIKSKHIGVSWTNLEVIGNDSMSLNIRTFPDAITGTFLGPIFKILSRLNKNRGRKLLQNFTGVAKPGEMVLVVGLPGSGCSTFLKTIANQRSGYIAVNGDVLYEGITAHEFAQKYQGEAVYNEEDDVHFPTLTVKQTLELALNLKSPGKRLPEQTVQSLNQEVLNTFLKMLGIPHTADTLVGSAVVRGVSGGERKRVSIAECMASRAAVLGWDNATRGLDASTALDYAKCMRVFTDIVGLTTFITLYQPGEGIWEQFDKVMVIDEGRCVYYGPRDKARQYFLDLGFKDYPRQTSADFCSGCTDPNLDRFAEGQDENTVPSTSERLEQAYLQSHFYQNMVREKEEYDAKVAADRSAEQEFRDAVLEDKHKGVRHKSIYTVSFFRQVQVLTVRQMQMILGNKFDIFVSFATTIAIALIVGGIFLNLPDTAAGGFTRGSVLFIGLLFNALTAFNELPTQMGGRPVLFKQMNYAFYRPAALSLAQTFADIPLSISRIILFSIILYFMAGLRRTAGAFFTFFLFVYFGYLAMSALFRLFGTVCKSYDVAARLAAVIISALVVFAGYVIPRDAMYRWLFWISYINPLYFAFSGVMMNEFKGLELACVGQYIVPRNPTGSNQYPDNVGNNQVCTLPGAISGNQFVAGNDYIRASFGYDSGDLWLYFGVVVIFFVGLVGVTMLAIEFFQHGQFSSALTIVKKPSKEEQKLNQRLKERASMKEKDSSQQLDVESKPFTWEKLCYEVPVKGGKRQLLDEVYGYCRPGTLTALMGASGAGKTTLLDVLADRKSIGVISGERLIDGKKIGIEFQRGCGYAEQQDIHEGTATVREALRFSAYLRQPAHVPKSDKDAYVEDIIELLEMQDIADAMIGMPEFGLGIGDRKRVTIGVELAARPDLLLFLDEPTSGLDGQTAYNVVRFLKKLAASGQAILCTIHQPNALLFEQFDRLLLLERGGKTVYFGDVGPNAKHIVKYFGDRGAHCPGNVNMAEYMLDAIGAGSQKRVGNKPWSELYKESDLFQQNLAEIEKIKQERGSSSKSDGSHEARKTEYATSFAFQVKTVLSRALLSTWRQPDYQFTRLFQHASIALITGLCFLNLDNSTASLQYRIFGIFMATVLPAIILAQIEPFFIMARSVFIREDSSKMYSGTVFAITQLIQEVPFGIVSVVVYFLLFYYPAGFQSGSDRAGYFFAMLLVTELFAVTLGQALAAISPSIYIASLFNPFMIVIMSLLCGVTIPYPNMPHFFKSWLYWVNPLTYLVSGLVTNELHQLPVRCSQNEFAVFQPPSGETCQAWAATFVNAFGGYLQNPSATADCQYCQYTDGDQFYATFNMEFSQRGRNIGIMIAFVAFNALATIAASRFIKYANR
ncbi:probable SNQ2-ABC transporter involved in multidrug resistance [Sporisorium reilianum f. sp. reilianum]|uniref:Probable SNQ2-ABC transporter involved in multidrug resistance n=1 Tax=Sporisorium reilianum f. sp. reilianum TaxID=72559 RepID=A0A2N8UJW2_9BASI|nr:probable SNQ2-ABC transporter involved in multidrug resistance [Sporisorium reilianum f. sp. reilianum]